MDARGQPVPVTRPCYPQVQGSASTSHSASSSAFNSSSSIASASPGSAQQASRMPNNSTSAVPLPSPSREQHSSNYFGGLQAPSQNGFPQHMASSQQCGAEMAGQIYVGQRGDGSGAPVTAPFLKDFNLVAEAAKRAQVACLTRDLGDVGL